jgi:UDP-N-acetylmuramoyl-L-alanyl-D-glutamate--2,6-diaminopimelate ligase
VLAVENLGEYVSDIAAVFYGQPSANIHLTGITGTNGKTTCSRLLAELMEVLSDSGSKQGSAAFVGTLGYGMVRDTGYQALHDAADKANDQPSAITETGLTHTGRIGQ